MSQTIITSQLINDDKIARLTDAEFKLFIILLVMVDRYGIYQISNIILAKLTGKTEPEISTILCSLQSYGLIATFTYHSDSYLVIKNYLKYNGLKRAGKIKTIPIEEFIYLQEQINPKHIDLVKNELCKNGFQSELSQFLQDHSCKLQDYSCPNTNTNTNSNTNSKEKKCVTSTHKEKTNTDNLTTDIKSILYDYVIQTKPNAITHILNLSQKEYDKLLDMYDLDFCKELIDTIYQHYNNRKKPYPSDYLAIRKWCVSAVMDKGFLPKQPDQSRYYNNVLLTDKEYSGLLKLCLNNDELCQYLSIYSSQKKRDRNITTDQDANNLIDLIKRKKNLAF